MLIRHPPEYLAHEFLYSFAIDMILASFDKFEDEKMS